MAQAWYALYVRTNGEAHVDEALRAKNYSTFLPTYIECKQYSDRIKKKEAALFPGYLFCRFDPQSRLPILTTSGVNHVVGDSAGPKAVDEEEIGAIRRALAARSTMQPWPFLKVGDRVRIEFGSLSGVEGILVRERGVDLLVLTVQLLQRAVAVQVDRSWIRPL